jgi:hypothetical protein
MRKRNGKHFKRIRQMTSSQKTKKTKIPHQAFRPHILDATISPRVSSCRRRQAKPSTKYYFQSISLTIHVLDISDPVKIAALQPHLQQTSSTPQDKAQHEGKLLSHGTFFGFWKGLAI